MMDWWNNIIFSDPWALWLLLLVPVIGILIYFFTGKRNPVLSLASFGYLKGIAVPNKVKWKIILPILRLMVLSLLLTAFARPQSRNGFKKSHGEGIDIMLCMDVSPSMYGIDSVIIVNHTPRVDLSPNRIESAKKEAMHFIDERPNDRIGVVTFSGETFSLCPLTEDHEVLKNLIQPVDAGFLGGGTSIGMGLAKAVERIKESKSKSKVIILLTDGENNGGKVQPLDAAQIAKTFGIRVYTIGLGSTTGKVLTPTAYNPDGSFIMNYMACDVDEKTLMQISGMTGGKYFRAGNDQKLEMIYSEINKLEKSEFDKNGKEQRKEEFLPFLLVAFFLIMLEFILRYTVFDSIT